MKTIDLVPRKIHIFAVVFLHIISQGWLMDQLESIH